MKIKKYIFACPIIIVFISLSLFLYLNIKVKININKNNRVIEIFNNIFKENQLNISSEYEINLPKLQIDNIDYIGFISILKDNVSLPVNNICNNSFLNINTACKYSNEPLIILGTNLKDGFYSYETYNKDDIIIFTNMLGQSFRYKIKEINRRNNLNNISNYNEDLIIIIKDYYDMEYIMFICEFN